MTRSKNKFMIGVNDLIAEIKDNSSIIFANSTSVFFSCFGRENDDHLRILIPDEYWNTPQGTILKNRLMLNINSDIHTKKTVRSELSNLLKGNEGHTGVKVTRSELATDLSNNYFELLCKQKKRFDSWFSSNLINEDCSY